MANALETAHNVEASPTLHQHRHIKLADRAQSALAALRRNGTSFVSFDRLLKIDVHEMDTDMIAKCRQQATRAIPDRVSSLSRQRSADWGCQTAIAESSHKQSERRSESRMSSRLISASTIRPDSGFIASETTLQRQLEPTKKICKRQQAPLAPEEHKHDSNPESSTTFNTASRSNSNTFVKANETSSKHVKPQRPSRDRQPLLPNLRSTTSLSTLRKIELTTTCTGPRKNCVKERESLFSRLRKKLITLSKRQRIDGAKIDDGSATTKKSSSKSSRLRSVNSTAAPSRTRPRLSGSRAAAPSRGSMRHADVPASAAQLRSDKQNKKLGSNRAHTAELDVKPSQFITSKTYTVPAGESREPRSDTPLGTMAPVWPGSQHTFASRITSDQVDSTPRRDGQFPKLDLTTSTQVGANKFDRRLSLRQTLVEIPLKHSSSLEHARLSTALARHLEALMLENDTLRAALDASTTHA